MNYASKTLSGLTLIAALAGASSAFAQLTITPVDSPAAVAATPATPTPASAQLKVGQDGKISMEGAPSGLTITPVGDAKVTPAPQTRAVPQVPPMSKEARDGFSAAYSWGALSGLIGAIALGFYARRRMVKHAAEVAVQEVQGRSAFKRQWAEQRAKKADAKKARKTKSTIRLMG